MKSLTISAGCLLLATFVSGECVTVEPVKPVAFQASSERVRIHALLNGKGLKDVRLVLFYSTEQQPRLALSTDQQGLATTPSLSPGHYRILATAPENQFSELYLDVSEKRQRVSSFLIDLTAKPLTPAVLAARTAAVENAPVTEHLREFKGLVQDPSGAAVPGAQIQVFRRGSSGGPIAKLKSDEAGHFALVLEKGTYVVFFQMLGFKAKTVALEVGQNGELGDLQILMRIGGC